MNIILLVLQQSEEDGLKGCWFLNNLNQTKGWRKSLLVLQQSEEDGLKACWLFNNLNQTKRWRKSLLVLRQSVKDVFRSKSKQNLLNCAYLELEFFIKNICIQSNESINKIEVSKKHSYLKRLHERRRTSI